MQRLSRRLLQGALGVQRRVYSDASASTGGNTGGNSGADPVVVLRNAIHQKRLGAAMRVVTRVPAYELRGLGADDAAALLRLTQTQTNVPGGQRLARLSLVLSTLAAAGIAPPPNAQTEEMSALFRAGRRRRAVALATQLGTRDARVAAADGLAAACPDVAGDALLASRAAFDARTVAAAVRTVAFLAHAGLFDRAARLLARLAAEPAFAALPLDDKERAYAGLAKGYASNANLAMATKTVNDFTRDCNAKRGVPSFAAIIEACVATNNPAEADLTYRDLRLSGLPAPAEVYVDLIRVHARAGNLTKAVNYFYKRNDLTVTTTTTTSATSNTNATATTTRYDEFKPSKPMYTALIQAHFINAELVVGFRVLRQAVHDFGPNFLFNQPSPLFAINLANFFTKSASVEDVISTVGKYLDNALGEHSQDELLKVWKNHETFKDAVCLYVADGLLQIANSQDSAALSVANADGSSSSSVIDQDHCRAIGLGLVDHLMKVSVKNIQNYHSNLTANAEAAVAEASTDTSSDQKPPRTNTYRKPIPPKSTLKNHQLIYKRAAAFALQTHASAATAQAATSIIPSAVAILQDAKKHSLTSLQIVQSYLDTVATAVSFEIIGVDEGVIQWVKTVDDLLADVGVEAVAADSLVRIAKGDGSVVVKDGVTLENFVREWCEGGGIVGGVKKNEAALKAFVDKYGIQQTVIEI
ncbi:hypothetical protein HK100_001417 [Physocladia obscura]|uniref:Uncharacterized protein n=1 Tax=Physocladia obscura TaxID=109957 RepID=A0AAD5SZT1_9FUNG|nr:hypothetical protein HK100_001417 [Physocladia obscura]